jgi:hypothetical protein
MANRFEDKERRWREQEDQDRERGRYEWRSRDRNRWRDYNRDEEEQNWQGRRDRDDWMTYGRPEDYDREGTRAGGTNYGIRGREDWERGHERGGHLGRQDYGYGGRGREDWDRGFERGGRMGRQDYGYDQQDWDRDYERRGRMGRQGYERGDRDWNEWDRDYERSERMRRFEEDQFIQNPYDYEYDEPEWTYTEVWMIEGPYTGLGPRGYQRDDDRIFEDVCERLTYHGQIDPSDVDVKVKDGEVTLKGRVQDRRSKRIIEDVAASVHGVMDVHNQLKVEDQHRHRWSEQGREQQHWTEREEQRKANYDQDKSQIGMQNRVREGMQVVGKDEGNIGEVKEVRQNDFLVDRPMARDVYVPFKACEHVTENRIRLNIHSDDVNDQGWPNPELIDTDQEENR